MKTRPIAEKIANQLTDITRQSFPNHSWHVYGGEDHGFTVRLIDKNRSYSRESEISNQDYQGLILAFRELNIGQTDIRWDPAKPHPATRFTLGTHSSYKRIRVSISNIYRAENAQNDLNWLKAHKDDLRRSINHHMGVYGFRAYMQGLAGRVNGVRGAISRVKSRLPQLRHS